MKRLLPILLAVALMVPGTSEAAKAKKTKKAKKTNVPEWAVESEKCSGDRDVKSVSLGKEVVYLSADLRMASFQRDEIHNVKHDLCYYCPQTNYYRRTPGLSPEGYPLVPAFRHGDVWHSLTRDANGAMVIDGAAAPAAPIMAPADQMYQAPAKKQKKSKKSKKGKKGTKKAKEAKETKEVKEAPAEPAKK